MMDRNRAKENKTLENYVKSFKEWLESLGCPEIPDEEPLKKLFLPHLRNRFLQLTKSSYNADKVRVWRKLELADFLERTSCPQRISVKLSTLEEFYKYGKMVAVETRLKYKEVEVKNLLEKVKEKQTLYHHLLDEYKSLVRRCKMANENNFKTMALEKSLGNSVQELTSKNVDLDSFFISKKVYNSEEEMKRALNEKLGAKLMAGRMNNKEVKNLIREVIISFPIADIYKELVNRFRHELDLGPPLKDLKKPQKDNLWMREMEEISIEEDQNVADLENTLKEEESEEAELWNEITELLSSDGECKDLLGDLKNSLLGSETQQAQPEGLKDHSHGDCCVLYRESCFIALNNIRKQELEYKKKFANRKKLSNLTEFIGGYKSYFSKSEISFPETVKTVLEMLESTGAESPSAESEIDLKPGLTNGTVSTLVPWNVSPVGLTSELQEITNQYETMVKKYQLITPFLRESLLPWNFHPRINESSIATSLSTSLKKLNDKLTVMSSKFQKIEQTFTFWIDQSICNSIPKGLLTIDGHDFVDVWKEILKSSQSIKQLEELNKKYDAN